MKSSGRLTSTRLSAGLPGLFLILGCGATSLLFIAAPSASAILYSTSIPTQENLWAPGDLPRPFVSQTEIGLPTDTSIPSATPTNLPASTETPASFSMEIVENAPAPINQQPQAPAPVVNVSGSKYILVDISEQHLYAYENNNIIFSFIASTGINNATRTGVFAVQTKLDNAYGATWNIWMPNWLGIYYSGSLENGIHALPILPNGATLWEGYLGRPVSYGCVVLATYESKLLYDWAEMGTPVEIQW